ncbi:hypothetical protein HYFRA_00000654 [Hymenoscyphus fraxineus]|uniref:Uncharacterized protein n=1 Tax=Hymenoscyphus fraxineus TaxID=746836 RepID=A0A9N9L382_9HELO|nr:hypothetical protein HYFRA_00000654 [Hymenoscyphus fraxineus]
MRFGIRLQRMKIPNLLYRVNEEEQAEEEQAALHILVNVGWAWGSDAFRGMNQHPAETPKCSRSRNCEGQKSRSVDGMPSYELLGLVTMHKESAGSMAVTFGSILNPT